MSEKICGTCIHWLATDSIGSVFGPYGICSRMGSEYVKDQEVENGLAYVGIYHDPKLRSVIYDDADLHCLSTFGCVLWEPMLLKEIEE